MKNWQSEFVEVSIAEIKATVGSQNAVVAVSGGVDSAVTAKVALEALGPDQLLVFTINDGFRREGEPEWVVRTFEGVEIPVQVVQAQKEFYRVLAGVADGDRRREIFSGKFGAVCGRVAREFGARYGFFGTNALDLKETESGAQRQHNAWQTMGIDTEAQYGFKVVEPIKDLLKEHIRALARILNLPRAISERMPFPGPGLAIRIMDAVTPESVELVRQATKIVEGDLLPLKPFQCLAFLMAGQATGKREGKGVFGQIISVRCLDSEDSGQTATATWLAKGLEQEITEQLLCLPGVTRVVFDPTPKPPGRIEYI